MLEGADMRRRFALCVAMLLVVASFGACKPEVDQTAGRTEDVREPAPALCEPCPPCQAPDGDATARTTAPGPEDKGPDECVLYHLVDRYEPTRFSHANHVDYEGDCEVCHHHASEVEKYPPCRACHGLGSDDLDKPGLKGAYHRQCMNCHRQMESGPLGCEECHKERERLAVSGEELARKYVQDTMKLGHISKDFAEVVFHHKIHVEVTDSCEACHHHHGEVEATPPCRECHRTAETDDRGGVPSLKDAYHEQCLTCHRASDKEGKKSPLQCTDCHHSRNAPRTVDLGAVAKRYKAVTFDHEMHVETTEFCTDCHHASKTFDRIVACGKCHAADKGPEGKLTLEDAFHKQCIGCHKKQDEGPQECDDCHEKKD